MGKKLYEIVSGLDSVNVDGRGNVEVSGIFDDSRDCIKDCLFVAIEGAKTDGNKFIFDAYKRGARVFLVSRLQRRINDETYIISKNVRKTLAELLSAFYDHPERQVKAIGITGTKGKTTTGIFLYEMLSGIGKKAMLIGTAGVYCNSIKNDVFFKGLKLNNTTPSAVTIYKLLSLAKTKEVGFVIIEVSSQALIQDRVFGIKFPYAVFTSFSVDHIGENEHSDIYDYYNAKESLFREYGVQYGYSMADDYYAVKATSFASRQILCGGSEDAKYFVDGFYPIPEGVGFHLCGESFIISVPGRHNGRNALLALAVASDLTNNPPSNFKKILKKIKLPGRLELYRLDDRNVIIDFAHNEDSIEAVCKCALEFTLGRIILVFGSVGGRAKCRRVMLAKAAERYAGFSIITSDDPDFESPYEICNEILSGFEDKRRAMIIPDRHEAILTALSISERGDTIILAGKGGEDHQLIKGCKIPFSEKEIITSLGALRSL